MKTLFFSLTGMWLFAFAAFGQDVAKVRAERDTMVDKGRWKEALDLYEEKLLPVGDENSGKDWNQVMICLGKLNDWGRFDDLLDRAVSAHPDEPRLLFAAGTSLQGVPHGGRILAGEFERQQGYYGGFRGGRRYFNPNPNDSDAGAGEMISCEHRDYVRALQLLKHAVDVAPDEEFRANVWGMISASLRGVGDGYTNGGWRLQILTPLDVLPDWRDQGPSGGTEGAPWAGDRPVLYEVPISWEAAKSDGERLRFSWAEQARLIPSRKAGCTLVLAQFNRSQFGVRTLAGYGWWGEQDEESGKAVLSVDTLADDECLAKTSDGVRRFKLPEDQHFIALYRSVFADPNLGGRAGDELVDEYLNRRQYDRAETTLREVISKHGAGPEKQREKLLAQITGSWGRFWSAKTVAAGTRPKIPLIFRNAGSIKLTAARIDMESVLRDIKDYISSNPPELDWQRIQPGQIGTKLLEGKAAKYLGEVEASWQQDLKPAEKHRDTNAEVEVPLDKAGAWWVTATLANGNTIHTVVWIIDTVIVQHDTAAGRQFWLVDASTGAPVADGEVEFFGHRAVSVERKQPQGRRYEIRTKSFSRTSDGEGRILLKPGDWDNEYQWSTVARKNGRGIAFGGFGPFYGYNGGDVQTNRALSYGVTDRPLYKAGDTVHMKFWMREVGYGKTNEARWAGKTCTAYFNDGRGQEVMKIENLKADALGAVEVESILPKNAALGSWTVRFEFSGGQGGSVVFRVEEYRKPEYEVSVEAPSEPVRLGDKFTATVKATYFHGAPVRNATVEITVNRESLGERWFPLWRWDWLYGRGAWWCGVEAPWHPGWKTWGCMAPPPPWFRGQRWTPPELVVKRTVPIGEDGTAKVEVDTAMAKMVHGDMDARYVIEAKVVDASRRKETGKGSVVAARKPFEIVVAANRGYARPGEDVEATVSAATLAGKPVVGAEGTLRLLRLIAGENGRIDEKEVSLWQVKTDAEGEIHQRFQAPAAGQYRLAAKLSHQGGEATEGGLILNVHGTDKPGDDWHFGGLELVPDKLFYAPGETVRLRVNSDQANAHVWLFLHAEQGGGREAKRIVLDGRSSEVQIPLSLDDMPNTFIEAITVHGAEVYTAVRQILMPPQSRALDVSVEPAKARVKPGEKSALAVIVREADGKPFQGTTTVTIYDKSLEAITGGPNAGSILENFWSWKHNYWGPRTIGSIPSSPAYLMESGVEAMQTLGVFGGSDAAGLVGGLGGSGGAFGRARGEVKAKASEASFDAVADLAAPASAPVAALRKNMAADEFGDGAEPSIAVRKDFADLLKWAGEVKTDADGRAEIPLEFPDNLTTWKARVWALGEGTRVGEGSAEIITSKELLVRLEAPRFLVEKDEAVFSAVVHNEHDAAKTVKVSLELEGSAVEQIAGETKSIEIPAKGETRVDWRVKALKEGEATVRMKAVSADDGDAIERKLPVIVHGMLRQEAWSRVVDPGKDSTRIEFEIPEQRRPDQTQLTVRFSPTVAGAVVDAIPYLADYPYGCTEQTLNRFVPAVIARKMVQDLGVNLDEIRAKRTNLNAQELGNAKDRAEQWRQWKRNPIFDDLEMEKIEQAGVDRLMNMQNSDGGWGWFSGYGEASYTHTTVVVVHGLLVAKANGAKVPDAMLNRGVAWLQSTEKKELTALKRYMARAEAEKAGKKPKPSKLYEKSSVDASDAFVRMVLGEAGKDNAEMVDFLFRGRQGLPVYAQCLTGLELHRKKDAGRRDEVMQTIAQFMKRDDENQTNYLDLKNGSYWWYWYGSDIEANSWYLKLLSAVKPKAPETRGLVKYLVNNRQHACYWKSTRDTAYAIEAIATYLKASGELAPKMDVEVLVDGKALRSVSIDRDNLFSFDGTVTVDAAGLATGKHTVELRRKGEGSLYGNVYLEVFSLEDFLKKAGLEVKVERHVYRLIEEEGTRAVPNSTGQVVNQRERKFRREELKDGDSLASGDRIEVELVLESKNDYEYLLFSDAKAAGFEATESLSGYVPGMIQAYMEPRDKTVDFFIRSLPRGRSQVTYQLRAEAPGKYHALPAKAEAMYAPELRANSDEIRLEVIEKK
ncbi:MAG: MG2 domain-containing protein [Luteolibacter sp.]